MHPIIEDTHLVQAPMFMMQRISDWILNTVWTYKDKPGYQTTKVFKFYPKDFKNWKYTKDNYENLNFEITVLIKEGLPEKDLNLKDEVNFHGQWVPNKKTLRFFYQKDKVTDKGKLENIVVPIVEHELIHWAQTFLSENGFAHDYGLPDASMRDKYDRMDDVPEDKKSDIVKIHPFLNREFYPVTTTIIRFCDIYFKRNNIQYKDQIKILNYIFGGKSKIKDIVKEDLPEHFDRLRKSLGILKDGNIKKWKMMLNKVVSYFKKD